MVLPWLIRIAALAAFALFIGAGAAAVWVGRGTGTEETTSRPSVARDPPIVRVVAPKPAPRPLRPSRWRRSNSFGLPWAGRLVAGVQLPAEGRTFFTWDPVRRRSPNREWRRWGSDRLVRVLLQVLTDFAAAHPRAPRIGVGDLSRPRGGDFGPRYGLPGHVSHQNGLDVDVYYPRRDRRELAPVRPAQIDRGLSQELVDRFIAAGAERVFVGFRTGLTGDPRFVQQLPRHDNHMHVRLP
jgi:murein endopeptidase